MVLPSAVLSVLSKLVLKSRNNNNNNIDLEQERTEKSRLTRKNSTEFFVSIHRIDTFIELEFIALKCWWIFAFGDAMCHSYNALFSYIVIHISDATWARTKFPNENGVFLVEMESQAMGTAYSFFYGVVLFCRSRAKSAFFMMCIRFIANRQR